jgi:hypothetical protein
MITALRQLTGLAELSVTDISTSSTIRLLNHLLPVASRERATVSDPHHSPARTAAAGSGGDFLATSAERLTIWERDRLLARVYTETYGTKLESTINCHACVRPFDLKFNLDELIEFIDSNRDESAIRERSGDFLVLHSGVSLRLPTGEDEEAISGLPEADAFAEMLCRCVPESTVDVSYIEEVLEKVAPMIQTDMLTYCPECKTDQQVHFDIQSFLLTRLLQERKNLFREIHLLASAYKWSFQDIIHLPRAQRKQFTDFIES